MQGGQEAARHDDHGALQDHEQHLVVGEQVAAETAREFYAAVHAPGEDGDGRDGEAAEEDVEDARAHEGLVVRVPGVLVGPHAVRKVAGGDGEEDQGEDLEAQTGQHDVLADSEHVLVPRRRGDAASNGLEKQTDEVAGAEDDGVGTGLEPGQVGAVDNDDAGEAEVDGGAQESRGNSQTDKIGKEVIVVKGLVVD